MKSVWSRAFVRDMWGLWKWLPTATPEERDALRAELQKMRTKPILKENDE